MDIMVLSLHFMTIPSSLSTFFFIKSLLFRLTIKIHDINSKYFVNLHFNIVIT